MKWNVSKQMFGKKRTEKQTNAKTENINLISPKDVLL